MAEWVIEDGIGERRAALVANGRILRMALEWDDDPMPRAGAVLAARLTRRADATGRGQVDTAHGLLLLAPVPSGLTEGAALLVEVVREALPEAGAIKPARARPAASGATPAPGPDLRQRIAADGLPLRSIPAGGGTLTMLGWQEALAEAASGVVTLPDLVLRISLTPAMVLIDVDGSLAAPALAVAGAGAAGATIRRFDLAGSIGIDLPTLPGKAERQAAAAALDDALPPPFERTGVNGFGFLQIVRRRERMSVMERLAADPVGAAARALIDAGLRAHGAGALTVQAHPRVCDRIAASPEWLDQLAAAAGAAVGLRPDPTLAIASGHASRQHP